MRDLLLHGEINSERRSLVLISMERKSPAVMSDDDRRNSEAKTRALGLGCKEGIKDAIARVFFNAASLVLNFDHNPIVVYTRSQPDLRVARVKLQWH